MRRRDFITGLAAGAVLTWPGVARGQQTLPVIGYLSGRSSDAEAALRTPFLKTLGEAGLVIDRNLAIDYRYSEGRDDRLPMLAAELVRRQVAVLVATDRPSALVAKAAAITTPIVFHSGADPVREGLVRSLNRPGGNATGVFVFNNELGPKRLDLLREILPRPGVIAFVVHPNSTSTPLQLEEMQAAARARAQPLLVLTAGTEREVDDAFATMAQQKVRAIVFGASVFYQVITDRLVALTAHHAIPALYEWREFVVAGGLMSYNASRAESGRQIGIYASQILKGAKPADLPVVQSSSFEFVLNLKTAKALSLNIPPALLARADEVIE
jgi:putative ABC transport system substrate-binding protein